jgi:hypothetical protein
VASNEFVFDIEWIPPYRTSRSQRSSDPAAGVAAKRKSRFIGELKIANGQNTLFDIGRLMFDVHFSVNPSYGSALPKVLINQTGCPPEAGKLFRPAAALKPDT